MTEQPVDTDLDEQQLEVLALLEAHGAALGHFDAPAHRIALEAYVWAALQHANTAPLMRSALLGTPRSAVAQGLSALRSRQFVGLTAEGFVLSRAGQDALNSVASQREEMDWHRKSLSEVVRSLHDEWSKMALGEPKSA